MPSPDTQARAERIGAASRAAPGHILGMDPDTALAEALDLAVGILDGEAEDGDDVRLAELIVGLNRWMSRGGFMPSAWERPTNWAQQRV